MRVTLSKLADLQGVSIPAVSRMAMRMLRKRMIERNGACGLTLTPAGRTQAVRLARRQRIIEVYFVRELGYAWYDVFEPAMRFSETADEGLVERMFELAGRPSACPHGSPIALDGDSVPIEQAPALSDLAVNGHFCIDSVRSHDTRLLRYIDACGLQPGALIEVVGRAPYGGIVHLRSPKGDQALGDALARLICVRPA